MTKHILGDSTYYWTYNSPKLPTIIMIHGFRGTHHGLDLIAKELPENHIIVPDLPGFGESRPLNGTHSLDNYTKWLHKFIEDLNLPEIPILLGHSFGSIVTSAYAAAYPNTISKLILVNPIGAPALEGPKALLTRLAIIYYLLGEKLPAKLANAWLSAKPIVMVMSRSMTKTKDKQLQSFIHGQHLQHFSTFASPKVVSEAFATSTKHTVRDSANSIAVKTLLIAGDKDDITPLHKQQELVNLFPSAKLEVIENVGHLTHYETPSQVAKAIKKFIQ